MPKFRLGFPVVRKVDGHSVGHRIYLGFKLGEERVCNDRIILTNNGSFTKKLNSKNPFKEHEQYIVNIIDRIFEHRAQGKSQLIFEYPENILEDDDGKDEDKLDMSSGSAGLALSVLVKVGRLDYKEDSATWDIFTSAIMRENGPEPIVDEGTLLEKAKACVGDGKAHRALLLMESDVKILLESSKISKELFGKRTHLESTQAFLEALEKQKRIFPLPLNDNGEWEYPKASSHRLSCAEGLVKLLEFEERPHVTPAPPLGEKEGRSGGGEPDPGSPAALFCAAVKGHEKLEQEILEGEERRHSFWTVLPKESLGRLDLREAQDDLFQPAWKAAKTLPNVIISGPTGCGKTLLAQALLINALASGKKGMYVAPTRALAGEVCRKFQTLLPRRKNDVFLSTGEAGDDDWRFAQASFDIACVVNEKANVILPMNPRTLKDLGVVVLDEIHMLTNVQRAGSLDMLLAKLKIAQGSGQDGYPRIVVVTTELLATDSAGEAPLVRYLYRGNVKPLSCNAEIRPQKVQHSAVLYGRGTALEVPIVEFSSQDNRKFDEAEGNSVGNRLYTNAEKVNSCKGDQPMSEVDVVLELAKKHKRFLVIGNSKDRLVYLCERACNARESLGGARKEEDENTRTARKMAGQQEKSDIPATLCQERQKWAKYGIYLHHAGEPRELRQLAEEVFLTDSKCHHTPTIFCTETLSYGVNLTADGMALLNLKFRRAGRGSDGGDEYLSANEYHNILGRIGRFASKGDTETAAYVLLDCKNSIPHDNIKALVTLYQDQEPISSQALRAEDITANSSGGWEDEDLDEVTFESFRTIMDALRMAQEQKQGEGVCERHIARVLKQTFFISSQEEMGKILKKENFIGNLLDLAAKKTFLDGSLRLVQKEEGEEGTVYKLTSCGQALIDTGISWKSVKPMANWLNKLKEVGETDVPADLLLPAFLACDEVSDGMLEAMSAVKKKAKRNDGLSLTQANEWRVRLEDAVKIQLTEILQGGEEKAVNMVKAIKDYARGEKQFTNMLRKRVGKEYEEQSELFFLAILGVTFDWLRGEQEEMRRYTNLDFKTDTGQHIPQSRFEHIAWAAQMCSRFFLKFLSPAQVADLPRLVRRLRQGVPLQYLPFAHGMILTSKQIRDLKNKRITPDVILRKRGYPDGMQSGNMPNGKEVYEAVWRFYKNQYNILAKRISHDLDHPLYEFMDRIRKKSPEGDDYVIFAKICGMVANFDEKEHCITIDNRYSIFLTYRNEPEEVKCDAVCYLPWRPEFDLVKDYPIFTPGGLFSLCKLYARDPDSCDPDLFDKCVKASGGNPISANTVLRSSDIDDYGQDVLAVMEPFTD